MKRAHFYPCIENEHYLSGTADTYYNYQKYQEKRRTWLTTGCQESMKEMESHFNRVQYVIFKNEGTPTEIILLEDGLMLDWDTEIEKGLDHISLKHHWDKAPLQGAYRFAHGFHLNPIGKIIWTAPDLFYWSKKHQAVLNNSQKR